MRPPAAALAAPAAPAVAAVADALPTVAAAAVQAAPAPTPAGAPQSAETGQHQVGTLQTRESGANCDCSDAEKACKSAAAGTAAARLLTAATAQHPPTYWLLPGWRLLHGVVCGRRAVAACPRRICLMRRWWLGSPPERLLCRLGRPAAAAAAATRCSPRPAAPVAATSAALQAAAADAQAVGACELPGRRWRRCWHAADAACRHARAPAGLVWH